MNHSLSVYQRGNRDGLLSLAAELDLQALAIADQLEKWKEAQGRRRNSGSIDRMIEVCAQRQYDIEQTAQLARRRAQALPEDPNNE